MAMLNISIPPRIEPNTRSPTAATGSVESSVTDVIVLSPLVAVPSARLTTVPPPDASPRSPSGASRAYYLGPLSGRPTTKTDPLVSRRDEFPLSACSPVRSAGASLAAVGATHPASLTYSSSEHWTVMHVVAMLVFSLVGAALVGLVWPRRDPVALAIGLAAYLYAVAYTALDLIAGVAAGFVTYQAGPEAQRTEAVVDLFDIGNQLGELGVWAFLTASIIVILNQVWWHRMRALVPALLLVVAGISFLDSHIYPWRGVVTVLVIGLATGSLAYLRPSGRALISAADLSAPGEDQNSRAEGSSIPRRAL